MGRKSSGYVADANNSCADCAYHHCRKSCMGMNKDGCKDGECLFTGKIGIKCWQTRCENFKQWYKKK